MPPGERYLATWRALPSIHAVDKNAFISIYISIHGRAFSKVKILSGSAAAGLIPFNKTPHQGEDTNTTILLQAATPSI